MAEELQMRSQDRRSCVRDAAFEVANLVRTHGLSWEQALSLVREIGDNRRELDKAAQAIMHQEQ